MSVTLSRVPVVVVDSRVDGAVKAEVKRRMVASERAKRSSRM